MDNFPRATCLINNFNYRDFVDEAVESALAQTRPFEQILVVDDGSTDGSLAALRARFADDRTVTIIGKQNAGQLSCFNAAIPHVTGDLLFFLDADDRYLPSYLETAVACYERTNADFLVAGLRQFGSGAQDDQALFGARDLGRSVLTTWFARSWIGGPTSCLSMKASLARRILPCPFEAAWKICADNVLVYGSSLLGAHKYFLGQPLVERRVHGNNLFYGRSADTKSKSQSLQFELEKNRLFAWYLAQAGFDIDGLLRLLAWEFRTLERPTFRELRRYLRIAWTNPQALSSKIKQTASLLAHAMEAPRQMVTTPAAGRPMIRRHRAA
jgi:glycosyltransferase involved in cell wall biosynthesis